MEDLFRKDTHKKIFEKVFETFHYDLSKTLSWFYYANPNLGNVSPKTMIDRGREDKLLKCIEALTEGNIS